MGEVSETSTMTTTTTTTTTTTKRKKKGRPSLLDLQKRSIKQQQKQHHQIDPPHSNSNNDDDDERKLKKQKLLIGLNSHLQNPTTLLPNSHNTGSHQNVVDGKVRKATDSKHGSQVVSGPTTPLPDKKLLLFILDRLQKKDTHGVFSEPVDPEELPDYHDIIKDPMDFGTIRKKIDGDGGFYISLEQFENDVFLVCSNAMQYNSPDTIYHRQARAMQEIARKDFENLRQDSEDDDDDDDNDSEPPPPPKIVQRGRPPGKHKKKSLGMSTVEHAAPESSSDATLASGGDIASGSNGYNLRKVVSKFQPSDSSTRALQYNSGGYTNWTSEWENEFPASVLKAVSRYGKKQFTVDETRRDTYRNPVAVGNETPVLTAFEDNFKQLLAVGLHVKHSYARSLAHFAADLGPVAWKVAARKISSVLPPGHEFGPGWVSDDDVSQKQHFAVRDERNSDPPVPEDYRSRFPSPSRTFSLANTSCLQSGDTVINRDPSYQNEMNPGSSVSGGNESMIHGRIQQEPAAHSDDFGSSGRLRSNFSPQMTMVRLSDITGSSNAGNAPQMVVMDTINSLSSQIAPTNINPAGLKAQFFNKSSHSDSSNLSAPESGFDPQRFSQGLAGKSSWQGLEVPTKQNSFSPGNDLNALMGAATNSHSSNVETGPQLQPNLALQL
ncbi:uncharacterized protein LOC123899279 isoform X2 [Trifolium pratense]|uniref:uncharacterized protein LOC123899279 isoform X2 n=1 Tax=Trifolium pratense TaxID=57577 RepID=UPI001E69575E|nr:uncharacterized protein LOC123899279 isoform X2 [Trifolium pratense]